MAREIAGWIEAEPGWELLAPVPFSTVCCRHAPAGLADDAAALDAHNERILARVNASGRIFLSHTKLAGRYTIRVTLGNPRATERHLEQCWALLREAASTSAP
jgi:aromatic-L-amino-acid decarboxylase